jgi:hypothetical protein
MFGLRCFRLGKHDLQNAVLVAGLDLVLIDGAGQRNDAPELAGAVFHPVIRLACFLLLFLFLARDPQIAVTQFDAYVVAREARQFHVDFEHVLRLDQVDGRDKTRPAGVAVLFSAEETLHQLFEVPFQPCQRARQPIEPGIAAIPRPGMRFFFLRRSSHDSNSLAKTRSFFRALNVARAAMQQRAGTSRQTPCRMYG